MQDKTRTWAIIAGSGFESLGNVVSETEVLTRYGRPSAPLRQVEIGGRSLWYLARHGDDFGIPAHRVNYRANLAALRQNEVDSVLALNTVGVIRQGLHPGQVAVPDQLIDYTSRREHTVHVGDGGATVHVDFTEPFSGELRQGLLQAARCAGVECHDGGVYAVTQGPRLETRAEVDRLERDGADFVGMTAMPEASLAREMSLRYACLSLIVNYAAGRGEKSIHEDLVAGTEQARGLALRVLRQFLQDSAGA